MLFGEVAKNCWCREAEVTDECIVRETQPRMRSRTADWLATDKDISFLLLQQSDSAYCCLVFIPPPCFSCFCLFVFGSYSHGSMKNDSAGLTGPMGTHSCDGVCVYSGRWVGLWLFDWYHASPQLVSLFAHKAEKDLWKSSNISYTILY